MSPNDERRTTEATFTEELHGAGRPFLATATHGPHLADIGWVEVELVAEGVAGSFVHAGEVGEDGRLELGPGPTAPYRTRVVVRRPADAAAFSGTVVVEWLNVSSGLDANPDWAFLCARAGAHRRGVGRGVGPVHRRRGRRRSPSTPARERGAGTGLKGHDPERYGSLAHPGDAFAYDIYTPGRRRRCAPGARRALGGLRVEQVLAIGESQSAFALTTYVERRAPRRLGLRRLPRAQPGPVGAPPRRGRARGSPGAGPSPARRSGSAPTSTSR